MHGISGSSTSRPRRFATAVLTFGIGVALTTTPLSAQRVAVSKPTLSPAELAQIRQSAHTVLSPAQLLARIRSAPGGTALLAHLSGSGSGSSGGSTGSGGTGGSGGTSASNSVTIDVMGGPWEVTPTDRSIFGTLELHVENALVAPGTTVMPSVMFGMNSSSYAVVIPIGFPGQIFVFSMDFAKGSPPGVPNMTITPSKYFPVQATGQAVVSCQSTGSYTFNCVAAVPKSAFGDASLIVQADQMVVMSHVTLTWM